jgi:AraC-like DNA-binding protein/quercetin dioxygenase-like cupin family protein
MGSALHQSFLPTQGRARAHVWKYSLQYGGRRPRHFHAEPEINLIVSGTAKFGIGEAVISASAGELLGFPPGQDHILLETSPDIYLFAIGLEPSFSSGILRTDRDSVAIPLRIRPAPNEFRTLAARASAIVDQENVDQPCAELWEQAHWLRQKHWGRANSSVHVLTRRALTVMSDSPEIGRELLAGKLRASPCEISRYFHRDVGMTLVQYRTRLRLLRFIRLMDDGICNLTASAKAAGFGSYSQCHRIFQTELGCAPRQFIRAGLRQEMQLVYES